MKKINWEKVNKFVKNKNFIIATCVFCLTIASIGFSYASFFSVKTNTTNQSITTGTLKVSYGSETSAIQRNNSLTPMSDKEGMNQNDVSVIYIQNTGTLDSTYVMNIGYDMENFTSRTGYKDTDMLTPLDYVRFAVYEYHGAGTADTLVAGPLSVTDLPIYKIDNSDSRNNRYSILFDTLGSTSSSNSTKTYRIKLWLSDKAISAASYSYFYVNAEIVAEVVNAKMNYTLNGTITDGTNNLSGAVVSLQNGSVTSTTSSSGAFSLAGVYPGVYNLDITYNNVVYSGNLTVEEKASNSLKSLGSTFNGSNIYTVANSYGTTISKIIKKNNIDTYSSAASISSGNLYPTYKFVGGGTTSISGMKIVLDTTNKTFTMSL